MQYEEFDENKILEEIEELLNNFQKDPFYVLPALQTIQMKFGYIPKKSIFTIGNYFGVSHNRVFGIATFYNQFKFNPPGKYQIKVCLGTACHVKGGEIILENFERKLGIKEGETTKDRKYSLERVACVGCCSLAPVVVINEDVEGYMMPSKVEGIIEKHKIEEEMEKRKEENSQ
jgi:NADH-quinone oxidoreductase subunit E